MDTATTNTSFGIPPSCLVTLEDCSEEAVYAPGHIQPHGVLLVLKKQDLTILQVSKNVELFFGLPANVLIGQSLSYLFPRTQVKRIAGLLKQDQMKFYTSFELTTHRGTKQVKQRWTSHRFRSHFHQDAEALVLELEPATTSQDSSTQVLQNYQQLQATILKLRYATSTLNLAQLLAEEVKAITGFSRVMIYHFEADDHGVVIAEEKEAHLESFLGLHYPATDIPTPARKLFHRNWVRQIPDINYAPASLHPILNPLTNSPLDLSACVLRGVSPYHIEYLQNMGVAGSLTVSLIDHKRLWGLIACHHYEPRLVSYETRKTCEFIGQLASIELVHQQDRELNAYRTQVKTIQRELQRTFLENPNFIEQVLIHNQQQLLDLVHAQGAAIYLDGSLSLIGQTPPEDEVQNLVMWLQHHREFQQEDQVFATDCLSKLYPDAQRWKDSASGLLATSVLLSQIKQKSYHILWFRPEQVQTVNWAGNPGGSVITDELGEMHLCPRKSFELWKETVCYASLPWQPAELEAAEEMRSTLLLAVLEFAQIALERAAERAAIANQAKSQFLAKMSHELRTPLNAILGFTQVIMRNSNIPNDLYEHLGIINRSGEYLLNLINDVLEMSRIEAGQTVLNPRHFNLQRFLQGIDDLFALKAAQKGITLTLDLNPNLPRYICTDEGKLRQILINLVSNAVKFTANGSVTIRTWIGRPQEILQSNCTCYPNTPPPCQTLTLFFAVEDTGCGIDVQHFKSIFEAFIQTNQGRHAEGTGLGLPISRQFARLMDGDIIVQSIINQGSIFTCWIEAHLPDITELLESETDYVVIGLEPEQATFRILIVEDALENRHLLTTILEPIGFDVVAVEDGESALLQWTVWHPHLILMDIDLPGMNGYEVTEQIRLREAANPESSEQSTKIIALTAYAFETDRVASFQAKCDDYLAKPFRETVLFEIIARHLGAQYRYITHHPCKSHTLNRKTLSLEDIAFMPWEWRVQVHEAALDLNDTTLRQLIAEIPQQHQSLIEGMTYLVENFQLEAIATLTQP